MLFKGTIGQAARKRETEYLRDLLCELLVGDQPMNRLNNEMTEMIGANRHPCTASVATQASPSVSP
jgi:hypothetical protein